MRIYKLLVDLPFLKRFNLYAFDDETGIVRLVDTDGRIVYINTKNVLCFEVIKENDVRG